MEQTELDKLAAEEQKRNEKTYRKTKWRNRVHSLFRKLPPLEDMGTVETPVETCELSDEFSELKEQTEAFMGKKN